MLNNVQSIFVMKKYQKKKSKWLCKTKYGIIYDIYFKSILFYSMITSKLQRIFCSISGNAVDVFLYTRLCWLLSWMYDEIYSRLIFLVEKKEEKDLENLFWLFVGFVWIT